MTKFLSIPAYLGALVAGLVVLTVGSVFLPHDPYIRWQSFAGTMFERTKYQYERIHFDEQPIDVVFIGSSRTAAGVSPPLLEAELAKRGMPLEVFDLSLPAAGMDIRVAQAREVLTARPEVKLLVFSVVEALPRDGHQAFADLASAREIVSSPVLINRNLPASLVKLPMRQMKLAAASLVPGAFGYQAGFRPGAYPGPDWDAVDGVELAPGYDLTSAQHREALAAESAQRKLEITPPLLPEDLAWLEFGVSRASIEEVMALAKRNGTEVVFMFLPFYQGYEEPRDAAWLRERSDLWIPGWMREEPSFYGDAAHGTDLLRRPLSAWLADRITARLAAEPTRGEPN